MTDVLGPANAPNAVTARPTDTRAGFGASDSWFKDCTSDTSEDGTDVQAGWLNKVTAALRALWRVNGSLGAGPVVNAEDDRDAGLADAIALLVQRGQPNYADDASVAANTVTVTLVPAAPEYKKGMRVHAKIANTNTGAATLNVNGLGAKSVLRPGGAPLRPGDLLATALVVFEYDGAAFQVVSGLAGNSEITPHSFARFTTPGTFSFPVPAGVKALTLWAWAAGSGGYAAAGAAASGGCSGAFARKTFSVTPGQVITGTIGAGGAVGTTTTGTANAGGDTSVVVAGTTYTVKGGSGGNNAASGLGLQPNNAAVVPAWGDVPRGGESGAGAFSGTFVYAGRGGTAFWGGIGGQAGSGGANDGAGTGAGGGGGADANNAGAGYAGEVWFEY